MIRLSEDGKTFVEIKEWEDLVTRPGFRQKLDPKEFALKQIIGQYTISPKQPCGIKSCGTKHNRGYLVLAEEGIETNIGNVCGKQIFGVEFTRHQNAFKLELNAQRYRESITAVKNRLGEIELRVQTSRAGDHRADWCYDKMHAQMTRFFPDEISRPLLLRAQRSNPVVSREVRLTEAEREAARPLAPGSTEQGRGTQFRSEALFTIMGLGAVISYRKIRAILNHRFGTELEALRAFDPTLAPHSELQYWHNWSNRIDSSFHELEEIIEDCNRFLAASNIEQIRNNRGYL